MWERITAKQLEERAMEELVILSSEFHTHSIQQILKFTITSLSLSTSVYHENICDDMRLYRTF